VELVEELRSGGLGFANIFRQQNLWLQEVSSVLQKVGVHFPFRNED